MDKRLPCPVLNTRQVELCALDWHSWRLARACTHKQGQVANDWPIGHFRTEADMDRQATPAKSVESDPSRTLARRKSGHAATRLVLHARAFGDPFIQANGPCAALPRCDRHRPLW